MARADNIPSLFLFRYTPVISPLQNQTLLETRKSEENHVVFAGVGIAATPPLLAKIGKTSTLHIEKRKT